MAKAGLPIDEAFRPETLLSWPIGSLLCPNIQSHYHAPYHHRYDYRNDNSIARYQKQNHRLESNINHILYLSEAYYVQTFSLTITDLIIIAMITVMTKDTKNKINPLESNINHMLYLSRQLLVYFWRFGFHRATFALVLSLSHNSPLTIIRILCQEWKCQIEIQPRLKMSSPDH